MKDAIAAKITTLPHALRQTLTWDRGKELAAHAQLSIDTGVQVYFADPHSPWQRGTNENTNGLLRQYFPKGTDLSRWDSEEIDAVATALNNRPRKTLNWRKHPPKPSTTIYYRSNQPVLRPPIEPGLGSAVGMMHQLGKIRVRLPNRVIERLQGQVLGAHRRRDRPADNLSVQTSVTNAV